MLTGTRVILRAWQESDVPAMQKIRNDIDLQEELLSEARPNSYDRTRQWLSDRSNRDDFILFIVADPENDHPLGFVQVAEINRRNGTGLFGICFLPVAQGLGLGAEVINLLEVYLLNIFGLRKLVLQVLASNARALKLYEKCGYKRVGVLSQHYKSSHGYADVVVMEHIFDKRF